MQATSATVHTYAYRGASQLADAGLGKRLFLATSLTASRDVREGEFFRGSLLAPRRAADQLLALSDVVRSRFHVPAAMLGKILLLADPVFTCAGNRLRFEAFSSCCSAYARLDLLPDALDGSFTGVGTSNVDFNAPMRAALGRLRDDDAVALALGAEHVEVTLDEASFVERKVALPERWLRGFCDVSFILADMRPRFDFDGAAFRRFVRELPVAWKGDAWLTPSAGGALVGSEPRGDASVRVGGIVRLRVLRSIARHATSARVFSSSESGATAWVVSTKDSRFTLALSPDVWRGFSGEGASLDALAANANPAALAATRASLRWQETVDAAEIAARATLDPRDVAWALAECASSGLLGFDLTASAYFHRELPFDAVASRRRQPRLQSAQRLVADARVTFDANDGPVAGAWVRSADVEYRVTFEGEHARCTCPWYAKHRETRGPCKHVLAVRLATTRDGRDAG